MKVVEGKTAQCGGYLIEAQCVGKVEVIPRRARVQKPLAGTVNPQTALPASPAEVQTVNPQTALPASLAEVQTVKLQTTPVASPVETQMRTPSITSVPTLHVEVCTPAVDVIQALTPDMLVTQRVDEHTMIAVSEAQGAQMTLRELFHNGREIHESDSDQQD